MEELMLAKADRVQVGIKNLEVFNCFCARLQRPAKLGNGNLVVYAKITGYLHHRLYTFMGRILLINHGLNKGRMWIDDGEEGFSEENFVLGSQNKTYSIGRSGRELVIEIPKEEFVVMRVEFEEII